MANHRNTHTNDTFTTTGGKTVRFEDIFVAIDEEVTRYGFRGGQGMTREDLEDLRGGPGRSPAGCLQESRGLQGVV